MLSMCAEELLTSLAREINRSESFHPRGSAVPTARTLLRALPASELAGG